MTTLDAALRGGAIALFLLLTALGWRGARETVAVRYGVLLALSAAAYIVEAAPIFADSCPPWLLPFRLLSISTPAAFYLWSAAHFDDAFTPSWRHWLPWFGMIALGAWAMATDWQAAWNVTRFIALGLVALGAAQALFGRAGDLVEDRRRLRLVLAIGAGAFIAVLNVLSLAAHGNPNTVAGIAAPAGVLALGFAASLLSLRASPRGDARNVAAGRATPRQPGAIGLAGGLPDASARELLALLEMLMEHDKVYRQEGSASARSPLEWTFRNTDCDG